MFDRMTMTLAAGIRAVLGHIPRRARIRHRTPRFRPNGAQEMARRVRQIVRYTLTGSNGLLLVTEDVRTAVDSHGEPYGFYETRKTYECGEGYTHTPDRPCGPYAHLHG